MFETWSCIYQDKNIQWLKFWFWIFIILCWKGNFKKTKKQKSQQQNKKIKQNKKR